MFPADQSRVIAMEGYSTHVSAGDWKKGYRLTMEIGITMSLLFLIGFFHLPIRGGGDFDLTTGPLETIQLEEIYQTTQPPKPPPPPRALTPIVVPDESLPDEEPLDLDASLDMNATLNVPSAPTPPPPPEKADTEEELEEEIFVVVEEMPTIIGGLERLYEVIEYPEMARQAGLEGMVVVQFIVTPQGTPIEPVVQRSAGKVLDQAAIDAIMQLTFTPGRQRQKPVSVRFSIPVRFRLEK